ncbi:MAG: carboxypeptidase regulatory-like domain-containing protein [Candidatus Hydrogenedentes bacterium]|nr:carboxypeptidase regulatory-like domain-containing protein [Candidatus Hydrogenedentota bacterium]
MWSRVGFAILVAAAAWAQPPADRDPAGPRTGPLYDVVIVLPDGAADLDRLNAQGYNVTSVDGNSATLVVTAEELLWLAADGYDVSGAEKHARAPIATPGAKGLGAYHSYATLTSALQDYDDNYGSGQNANPKIFDLISIGKSVNNRDIWAVKITDKLNKEESEPEFRYIATIHGDEPVGTEMCLYFIDLLLTEYGSDSRITKLVDNTEIWIVPLMNPDGLESVERFNENGFDLNRNFPKWPEDISGTIFEGAPLNDSGRQVETQAMMQWSASHNFVLSANFHGGARIVNYPYDDDNKGSGVEAPAPDEDLLHDVALRYSTPNSPMYNNSVPDSPGGVINGSLWYEITGGMQDWNYRYLGCNDMTIELDATKIPNENQLDDLWDDNRESMLTYAEAVHIGVKGIVKDKDTGDPLYARIEVIGNEQPVFTDPDKGDYHRLLLPGTYDLKITAPGYKNKKVRDVVVAEGEATTVNVKLKPVALKTDLNGDGKTNSIDIQRMVTALLNTPDEKSCDVDSDGKLTVSDLQLIVSHVAAS